VFDVSCARNKQRVVILRGVTDLGSREVGEAYGNMVFADGANIVMRRLFGELPAWLERLP